MGHKRQDCFERPRKVLAKFNNANIAPDEFEQPNLALDYDGKRDRWAGYDPSEHKTIVEEYKKIEEAKQQMRAEKLTSKETEKEDEQDSDADKDTYVDEVDMPGTKVDSKQRITVRNLRIREDTTKYLRNLNPNSAYYDPKTRSMRDNPYAGTEKEVDYKGENSIRFTGDTQKHAGSQLFAWEAHDKGVPVHLLAEPTKVELLKQEFDKKRDELKDKARNAEKQEKQENKKKKNEEKIEKNKDENIDEAILERRKKRGYNSMYDIKEPTEKDIEQYQMKRLREEDPMAQFMNDN